MGTVFTGSFRQRHARRARCLTSWSSTSASLCRSKLRTRSARSRCSPDLHGKTLSTVFTALHEEPFSSLTSLYMSAWPLTCGQAIYSCRKREQSMAIQPVTNAQGEVIGQVTPRLKPGLVTTHVQVLPKAP